MRVLMVTHTYPRFAGDTTAPFVESIAHAVADRGHDVDVLLPETPGLSVTPHDRLRAIPYSYRHGRFPVWGYGQAMDAGGRVRLAMYGALPVVAAALRRRLRELMAAHRYDVLHVHWAIPNGVLVARAARRVPLVLSLHGSDISLAERSRFIRPFAHRALTAARVVTAPSSDLAERAGALAGRSTRIRRIPYGVDPDLFSPNREVDRELWRRRLGAGGDSCLVLSVGRLVEVKGFPFLIDAASRVSGIRIAIAGAGDLHADLERQIRSSGAPVQLIGELDRSSVADALAAADVVAIPSVVDSKGRVDGLPNTLLEAMASGRPVVASRVGGIPDVLEDEANGLLVPPRDAAALAAALSLLAKDLRARQRLGEEARRTILAGYTWDDVARALESAYELAASPDATSG